MGVFSFMETFFFISLGITFVMIIMLVYHFKQRMIMLERKHDTMFDIVNNIVKQIKNMQVHISYLGENQYVGGHGGHGGHGIHHVNMNDNIVSFANGLPPINMHEFNMKFNDVSEVNIIKGEEDDEEEDEDDDEEEEDEDEDDDEEDDDEEDDDEDEDDEDDDEDGEEDDESNDNVQEPSNIKVINVEINDLDTTNLGIVDIAQISEISEIAGATESTESTEIKSTNLEQNMDINDDEIIIRKIDKTIVKENTPQETQETQENQETQETKETKKSDDKKKKKKKNKKGKQKPGVENQWEAMNKLG